MFDQAEPEESGDLAEGRAAEAGVAATRGQR
jgi:hypothetical protein